MRIASFVLSLALVGGVACSETLPTVAPVAAHDGGSPIEPTRERSASVAFDENGISEPLAFVVPPSTRSIAVVVEGEAAHLHALVSFTMADGVELVGIDIARSHTDAMQHNYFTEQSGTMPGELRQSPRLGTFTHVYPYAPDQTVIEGTATLRVVRDAPFGAATVRVLMAPDDGARVLHLNLVRVTATEDLPADPPFLRELRRIFRQADIEVVVDEVLTLRDTGLEKIASMTEPQETSESDSVSLARMVGATTSTTALDVMIVDALPPGVGGLSLGVPGPPMPESYYYGVLVESGPDARSVARVIAHETSHFLGLQHVVNRGASGRLYLDPIPDTVDEATNLMAHGTELTPGQAFVLTRSPLLSTN